MRVGQIVGTVMALLLVALAASSTLLLDRIFGMLQDGMIEAKIVRVAEAIRLASDAKIKHVRDAAEWDDTYAFLEGSNPGYLEDNYGPESDSSKQDVILIFDSSRTLAGAICPSNEEDPFALPANLEPGVLAVGPLLGADGRADLVVAGDEVLLLAACPVLKSNRDGPSNGWLIYGTFLDRERLAELAAVSGAASIEARIVEEFAPSSVARRIEAANPGAGSAIGYYVSAFDWKPGNPPTPSLLLVESLSSAAVLFEFSTDFQVFEHAVVAKRWIVGITAAALAIIGLVGWMVIRWHVVEPIVALDRAMASMAGSERPEGRLDADRNDEIGRLACSANRLLERIMAGRADAEAQRALLDGVLDSAEEGVEAFRAVRNASGEIEDFEMVVVNRAAARLCRLERHQLAGARMVATFPRTKESGVFGCCVRVIESRRPETFEIFYEGHQLTGWLRFSIAPWEDGVVLTFEDIGERKNKERELAESYAEIERFNAAMVGREERVIQMKREVNTLRARLGEPPAYEVDT